MKGFMDKVLERREHEQEVDILRTPGSALLGPKKPSETSMEPSAESPTTPAEPAKPEVRFCPHCLQPLRVDNKKGICAKCWNRGKRPVKTATTDPGAAATLVVDAPAGERIRELSEPTKERVVARVKKGYDKLRSQFRALADALGLDPDDLEAQWREEWMKKAREGALAATQAAGELPETPAAPTSPSHSDDL